jgi:hypothetical protein
LKGIDNECRECILKSDLPAPTSLQIHAAQAKKTLPTTTTPNMKVVQETSKTQRAHDFWTTLDKPG